MGPRRALGLLIVSSLVLPTLPALAQVRDAGAPAQEPADRYTVLLRDAWGPESPDALAKYLEARASLRKLYVQYEDGVTQWALREAGTHSTIGMSVMGVMRMRETLDRELARVGLSDDDFTRMTILVYGRWLRAVRPEDPPEKRVLRTLQEIQLGLERQFQNNPPADPGKRKQVEERLASVTFQARFIAPFALADKAQTLAKIDPATKQWLESHRKEIEDLDFGVFDTAAPPRPRTAKY